MTISNLYCSFLYPLLAFTINHFLLLILHCFEKERGKSILFECKIKPTKNLQRTLFCICWKYWPLLADLLEAYKKFEMKVWSILHLFSYVRIAKIKHKQLSENRLSNRCKDFGQRFRFSANGMTLHLFL